MMTLVLAEAGSWLTPMAWMYVGFIALVMVFLALDLGVFHRTAHVVSMREAATWTGVWFTAALLFNVFVYFAYEGHWLGIGTAVAQLDGGVRDVGGLEAAKLYLTGYIVEKSLAMDNVFVIAMIFSYFAVPAIYQHRVLFWGILGALIMRGAMIAVGAALIQQFSWIIYVFGGFLILTALKMALVKSDGIDPEKNPLVRLVKRFYPVSPRYEGDHFFTRVNGARAVTPLLLALVMVEFTDVIFAVDSIPAIFAITADPFLVFTSNIFAILGLRSLYFCLASLIDRFQYLKPALIAILFFVGVKMMLVHTTFKVDTTVSLLVVLGILAAGVVTSLMRSPRAVQRGAELPPRTDAVRQG
ncbi:MAG TPA: TerC family protein [Phycisphaerales bacterium]|nr:TerC family protein [Phycisphaerales bacterium]